MRVVWGLSGAVGPETGEDELMGPSCPLSSLKTILHPSGRQELSPTAVAGPGLRPSLPLGGLGLPSRAGHAPPGPVAPWTPAAGGWWWGLQIRFSSPLCAPWSLPSPYPLRSPFPYSPSLLPCPVPAPPSPPPLAIRAAAAGPDPPGSARPLAEPPPPPRLLRRRPPAGAPGAGHKTGQSRRLGH